jgi:PAS domain S-box-containing protein
MNFIKNILQNILPKAVQSLAIGNNAAEEKTFAAEKDISWLRGAVIVFNSLVYIFFMNKVGVIPWLANTIIVVASIYAFAVILFQPFRKYPILVSSNITYIADAILITLWLMATGGFGSPFYLLWYVSLIAVSFRFSSRTILLTGFVYSICYIGLILLIGEVAGNITELVVRVSYIFFTALLGILISREILKQTQQKKEMEQLALEAGEAEEMLKVQTQLYQNLLKAQSEIGEGVSITEGERFVYVNDALCRIYGYSKEELLSMPSFLELVAPEEREAFTKIFKRRFSGSLVAENGQLSIIRKDGKKIYITFSEKMMEFNGKKQLFSIIRDITDEVRSKETLLQKTIDLAKSKELDKKKDEFIGVASHELKTPLTSIKGYAQLLEEVLSEEPVDPDTTRLYIKKAQHQIDRVCELVDDLLDVSRIQAGKIMFNIIKFDIGELVEEVAEGLQHTSRSYTIEVKDRFSEIVKGDRMRLEQVLTNFITNAIKYSPKAERVIVRMSRKNNEVVVSVKDFGMGIPAKDLKKVFNRFYRVNNMESNVSGLGIGLYISAEIIRRHNGRIWAESEPGKGSTFYFTLPLNQKNVLVKDS